MRDDAVDRLIERLATDLLPALAVALCTDATALEVQSLDRLGDIVAELAFVMRVDLLPSL